MGDVVASFILGVVSTLVVQYIYNTYVKGSGCCEAPAPVVNVVGPAEKKVRKPRAKKTKKG